jgi:hypothetical protein
MLSLILNFGARVMGAPLSTLRSQQLGPRTATTSSFKAAAETAACIASTSAVASSQGFGPATLHTAPQSLDFRKWHIASIPGFARNSDVCESIDILVRRRRKQASVHSLLFPVFGRLI